MTLAADLDAHQPLPPGCTVARILAALDKESAAKLTAAMSNPAWMTGKLCDLLRKNGHKIGDGTMNAHRNGTCICVAR